MVKIIVKDIASNWISFYSLEASDEANDFEWAEIEMDYLSTCNPKKCWEVILEILHQTENEHCLSRLSIGPFESVLFHHSDLILSLIRVEVKKNPKFKKVFAGALQEAVSDEEWDKIFK